MPVYKLFILKTPPRSRNYQHWVSFRVTRGKTLGIVGESGSGKSISALSILQLIENPGKIVGGSINFKGEELTEAKNSRMRDIRGN